MCDIERKVIAILLTSCEDWEGPVGPATSLRDLGVGALDLAVIIIDIEDTLAIDFGYDPDEDAGAFHTVGALVDRAAALLNAKTRRASSQIAVNRGRSLWLASSRAA